MSAKGCSSKVTIMIMTHAHWRNSAFFYTIANSCCLRGVLKVRQIAAKPKHAATGDVFDTVIFVHACKLTVPIVASLLFARKKARAARRNVGNHYCRLSLYHEKAYPTCKSLLRSSLSTNIIAIPALVADWVL